MKWDWRWLSVPGAVVGGVTVWTTFDLPIPETRRAAETRVLELQREVLRYRAEQIEDLRKMKVVHVELSIAVVDHRLKVLTSKQALTSAERVELAELQAWRDRLEDVKFDLQQMLPARPHRWEALDAGSERR